MKTYVITLSQHFPATHPKAGRKTHFKTKLVKAGIIPFDYHAYTIVPEGPQFKFHTIRANYPLWKKRFEQINRGEACLSIRQWTGKPYASKQVEIARLTKEDGIGIQMLTFYNNDIEAFNLPEINDDHTWHLEDIAENDGLDIFSWLDWFKDYDLSKPMAIIHFTKFRYR
jgi:hypothetical protein